MAQARTTLGAAVSVQATSIVVASASGFAANLWLSVDNGSEWMQISKSYTTGTTIPVQRGLDGTVQAAHVTGASVVVYQLATDLGSLAPGTATVIPIAGRAVIRSSVTASGAFAPSVPGADYDLQINGTTIVALTLTSPNPDMDGVRVTIGGNGKAAHTVTYTTVGFGNVGATADVMTFNATQAQAFTFEAMGGFWNLVGYVAGAATVAGPGVA